MTKAILSYAIGDAHTKMHQMTLQPKVDYALKHNYDLIVPEVEFKDRPASWEKVGILKELLTAYDEVLFLGCDVLIVNQDKDIAENIPSQAWQALVVHDVDSMPGASRVGYIPNCDVWFLRKQMIPVLKQIEELLPQLQNHGWWEQAALMHLMGYSLELPCIRQRVSPLWNLTYELDARWNYHPYAKCLGDPYYKHATGYDIPTRLMLLESWLQ